MVRTLNRARMDAGRARIVAALHAPYSVALSTASVSDRLLVDPRPLSDAEVHSLTVVVPITASPSFQSAAAIETMGAPSHMLGHRNIEPTLVLSAKPRKTE